jgi:hypothetical protein
VLIANLPDVGYGTDAGEEYLDGYIMREGTPDDFLFYTNSDGTPISQNGSWVFNHRYNKLNESNPNTHPNCTRPAIGFASRSGRPSALPS